MVVMSYWGSSLIEYCRVIYNGLIFYLEGVEIRVKYKEL